MAVFPIDLHDHGNQESSEESYEEDYEESVPIEGADENTTLA